MGCDNELGKNLFASFNNGPIIKYLEPVELQIPECYMSFTLIPNKLPERYIIKEDATILFWKDNTKTIVKKSKDEKFDKRLAFLTAYFQKHCGMTKTQANKYLDELVVLEEKEEGK